ncbi:type III secretion system protein SctP [Burkholderia pyrrocinia]|uniref:type III secretion system protein SctP n=1 Tax=Burkholderia pyrrocinia TaxID=60550 RepID=UPI00068CBADB|nr:type III secretion system protein SctP [Burkholderia pyrrocinia]
MTTHPITPRIHAPDDDADDGAHRVPRPARSRRGIDYAELVRDARERGERAALHDALRTHGRRTRGDALRKPTDAASSDDTAADAADQSDAGANGTDDDLDADAPPAERARRLDAQVRPFVAALGAEQVRVVELMRFVAAHVADFCSDAAVLENGNWTVRLRLDPDLLPGCTLELHLSYFDLALRFDADAPDIRQLVCRHVHVLHEQLANLLHRLAVARHVSIEVA